MNPSSADKSAAAAADLPILYRQPVAVSRELHAQWGLQLPAVGRYAFARQAAILPVVGPEFQKASMEYPLVFVDTPTGVNAAIVIGLLPNQNLFVTNEGDWRGNYVPAYVRRYPFISATAGDSSHFTLCMDAAYEGFVTGDCADDERLWNNDGQEGPALANMLPLVRDYHAATESTARFAGSLREWGLLESMDVQVELKNGRKHTLNGLSRVVPERLNTLSNERIVAMVKSGRMEWVYAHISSLQHFRSLLDWYAAAD